MLSSWQAEPANTSIGVEVLAAQETAGTSKGAAGLGYTTPGLGWLQSSTCVVQFVYSGPAPDQAFSMSASDCALKPLAHVTSWSGLGGCGSGCETQPMVEYCNATVSQNWHCTEAVPTRPRFGAGSEK